MGRAPHVSILGGLVRTLLLILPLVGCTTYAPPPAAQGDHARSPDTLRVVSWNIETIGDLGSAEYDAALQILARLDADVVALQEVEWSTDEHTLHPFAADAGYDHVASGWPVSFGEDTQVVLSRYPLTAELLDGDDLSGDPLANDLTRSIPVATIDVDGTSVVLATAHFKASNGDDDEFRRSVDAIRGVQALGSFDASADYVLFCGDLNDDLDDSADWPATWNWAPWGMPSSYQLGSDLVDRMASEGLPNSAFAPFDAAGLHVVYAEQRDGQTLTRPESGRRLDYCYGSDPVLATAEGEVYDTDDEGLPGLDLAGSAPTVDVLSAADHLPVIVDFVVPRSTQTVEPTEPTEPTDGVSVFDLAVGDLRITEAMPNPYPCADADGEWVEVRNTTADAVDLTGLQLCDRAGCTEVSGVGTLPAGEVALFARTADACGLPVDGTFGRPLNNGGDDIMLLGSVELDRVDYGWADADRSWVWDDAGSCQTSTGASTPGEALDCDGLPLDGGMGADWTADDVPVGVLRLTEVMPNPSACADEEGEWIELHNTGDRAVDLTGLGLADRSGSEVLDTTLVLAPQARALFARTLGACELPYIDGTFQLALTNGGGDDLALTRPDGTLLDAMAYPYAPSGQSWVLDGGSWWVSNQPSPGTP